jgi:hypothetical protein
MKMTLTQAWEARGFSGVALRTAVGFKLTERFLKENPDKKTVAKWGAQEFGISLLFGCIGVVGLYLIMPFLRSLDLSLSLHLGILILIGATIALLFIAAIVLGMFAVKDFSAVGLVDRYIFQHRDEEIEL